MVSERLKSEIDALDLDSCRKLLSFVKDTISIKSAMAERPIYGKAGKMWSGYGRRPQWVIDHLNSGGQLSDLIVQK